MDLKQGYRNVPIHPQDPLLLGMEWQGDVFVDKVLPFGYLSSDTKVAENLAMWSLGVFIYNAYAELFHCPSILIVESLIPFWAAVIAAPILKLCPE